MVMSLSQFIPPSNHTDKIMSSEIVAEKILQVRVALEVDQPHDYKALLLVGEMVVAVDRH